MIFLNFVIIIILVILNAFFVSVEFSVVTSRRSRLDIIADPESRASKLVKSWLEDPAKRDRLIAASQLGVTVVSLALGSVGENAFEELLTPYFQQWMAAPGGGALKTVLTALPLVLSLLIVTSVEVVFGEQVPKVAVLRNPEKVAVMAAPIMQVFNTVFHGFISLLDWSTRQVLLWFGIQTGSEHGTVYSLEELKNMVSGPELAGVIEQPEREMLTAVIDFGELVVRQVSIPRTDMVAVEAETPLKELVSLMARQPITKYPVYDDNLDQIIGVVHVRDALAAVQDPTKKDSTARTLAREVLFVPETISVNDLLVQFRARQQHIAIVLDEYGGTAGLVTLEDLVDEILGEYRGPFESNKPEIQQLSDGSALIHGSTLIEDVNDRFGLTLADENYDTIAGYILGRLDHIPRIGEETTDPQGKVRLIVKGMHRLRITEVLLKRRAQVN
jgi:CBS domain containing-hemolysin-like protein